MCFFFNPSPVRRVPIPNRYTAKAKFCFCKNNKRTIIMCQSSLVLGAKLAALRTFYGLVTRVMIMCIHVHPGIFSRMKVRLAPRA